MFIFPLYEEQEIRLIRLIRRVSNLLSEKFVSFVENNE